MKEMIGNGLTVPDFKPMVLGQKSDMPVPMPLAGASRPSVLKYVVDLNPVVEALKQRDSSSLKYTEVVASKFKYDFSALGGKTTSRTSKVSATNTRLVLVIYIAVAFFTLKVVRKVIVLPLSLF